MHRKLPYALISKFEHSASKFTKRTFDNNVQNRFNKSKILNAKGIFPNSQNIYKMKSEYKCRLSVY